MKIFAIADLHLSNDERIKKPMDIFGSRWQDHGERVRENWLSLVSSEDLVLIPGDISWGLKMEEAMADLQWIHELPGQKVLLKGNHDLWWTSIGKMNELYQDMLFLQNHCYMAQTKEGRDTGLAVCGTRGWICPGISGFDDHDRKIYERELIRLRFSLEEARAKGARDIIAALHYPPTNDKKQPSGFTEMLEEFGVRECIYGHLHGKENFHNGIMGNLNGISYQLVSLDYLECVPKLIREI